MIAFPGEGLWADISFDDYHADPCPRPSLSAGMACDLMARTPAHVREASSRLNPTAEQDDDPKFDLGTAAHAVITAVGDPIFRVDAPDWRTKAAKEAREEARAMGRTPLLAHQHDEVLEMVAAAHAQLAAHPAGNPFLTGDNEMSMFWEADGIWNRGRPDSLTKDAIVWDYKTTKGSASPQSWPRTAEGMGSHIRVAHYIDGLSRLALSPRPWRYRFVVQEVVRPFPLMIFEASEGMRELGARDLAKGREVFRECLRTDLWPGYPAEIAPLDMSPWGESRIVARELADDDRRNRHPSTSILSDLIAWQAPERITA